MSPDSNGNVTRTTQSVFNGLCHQIVMKYHQNDSFRIQWFVSPDCNGKVTRTTHSVFNGLCYQIVMGVSSKRRIPFFHGFCHQNDSIRFQWLVSPDCDGNVTRTTRSVFNDLCHQIVMGMSPERLNSFSIACHEIVMGMSPE